MKRTVVVFFFLGFILSLAGVGWTTATPARERLDSYQKHLEMVEESIFKCLKWREIGPYFTGGRITDIEGYAHNPNKYYVASASGGLWLTVNNATTWTPVFDNESSITIGDIAVSQTDEKLVWVGTGEQNSSRSTYAGTGVFKSIDGGQTWKNMGLTDSHHISRVVIDEKDNNVVYVAVLGHLYTDSEERGLYKTIDGGNTWERVLYMSPKTGFIDVALDPRDSRVVYAASWQRERKAWNFVESGEESSIFKSVDSGKTWKKIVKGFPQNKYVGRIGLAVCPSNPEVIYAFLDNQEPRPKEKPAGEGKGSSGEKKDANDNLFETDIKGAEVYRSNDSGETWFKTHDRYLDNVVYTYGYYFGQVRVAPDNVEKVYVLGVPILKSIDGGKSFKDIANEDEWTGDTNVHADMQALWIDPQSPGRLILGNDGGVNISYDEGSTWQKITNLPLAQCYTINYDMQTPYRVYTGLQDNGVNMGYANFRFGSSENPWRMILGGDGAFVCPDLDDPDTVYAEFQFGYIFRLNLKDRGKAKRIQPRSPDEKSAYRFNWLSPFFISSHNNQVLYMGGNKVFKTVNRGEYWEEISPDLTNQQHIDGDVPFATIVALAESPLQPGLLYAGTDDGNVWIKKNELTAWEKIDNGLPDKWVTRLVPSKYKKERVYITLTGYRDDDFATYVFASEDYGKTWTTVKANLPGEAVNVIREDPVNENILYLGTDLGIYVTLDRGQSWYSLKNNLPTNAVYDLQVHPRENELVIATHGRGVFILPVRHIQALSAGVLKKPVHILDVPTVRLFTGQYAQYQRPVTVTYYANSAGPLQVTIGSREGKKVFSIDLNSNTGINTWTWDLLVNQEKKERIQAGEYKIIFKKGKTSEEGKWVVE